jgi:hypothetical protein
MKCDEMVCQWKLITDAGFRIMNEEHKREGRNVVGKKATNFGGSGGRHAEGGGPTFCYSQNKCYIM